ncbi:hypothetical protein ACH3VR_22900 [Microbacterium sp. B2969]|uniref:Uncharacterized protein n=1 Tax=Microbacterium alkaliflavum TaxID=3248839 RepID=A0ABW7QFU2_9MICO
MTDPADGGGDGVAMNDNEPVGITDEDVERAVSRLGDAPFTARFVRTDCQAETPAWLTEAGEPIRDHVSGLRESFKGEVAGYGVRDLEGTTFAKTVGDTRLIAAAGRIFEPYVPTASDLLHVYGPDRDGTKDWRRYYRYAWRQEGPHGTIYSTEDDIIRRGRLMSITDSYSGQSSYMIAGAGMFYVPAWGDANVTVHPYVQWQTESSFTGQQTPATSKALLGIYVESWSRTSGAGYVADRDQPITVYSQSSSGYAVDVAAGGAATQDDGLTTTFVATPSRKYHIFVYTYGETTASSEHEKNNFRYVNIDIDATVPYVLVQEELL